MEKFPEKTIATLAAARRTAASCAEVKPVDPMTSAGRPAEAAARASATEAAGDEKSITTSAARIAAAALVRTRPAEPQPSEAGRPKSAVEFEVVARGQDLGHRLPHATERASDGDPDLFAHPFNSLPDSRCVA